MSDPATDVPAPETTHVTSEVTPAIEPAPVAPVEVPVTQPEPVVAPAPVVNVSQATASAHDVLIDEWFADHFSDQVFSREGSVWPQAYSAKEHLKSLLQNSNIPAFDGLIDQWFWDSFANSDFSHDVTVWNVAYDAKQKLKFLFATR